MTLKNLETVSVVNTIGLVLIILFLFWIMIQFPETQLEHSNEIFQQKIEQAQSIEEIKEAAKNFSQRIKFTQNATNLISGSTILLDFVLIILLTTNFFMIRKMKKALQQNND